MKVAMMYCANLGEYNIMTGMASPVQLHNGIDVFTIAEHVQSQPHNSMKDSN